MKILRELTIALEDVSGSSSAQREAGCVWAEGTYLVVLLEQNEDEETLVNARLLLAISLFQSDGFQVWRPPFLSCCAEMGISRLRKSSKLS